jgi:hypothetical protein
MEDFLRFLNTYELWIYVVLGIIFLVYFNKLYNAWKGWKTTLFGLEKENAQRTMSSAMTIVGLIGLMILAEFLVISFVVPSYPRSLFLATPTLDLLATPTATINVLDAQSMTSAGRAVTPVQEGASGCIPGQLEWIEPLDGEIVSGVKTLIGTVNIPTIGFYKYEFSAAGSNTWVTIAAGNDQKTKEELGTWNAGQLVPGDYVLRLIVTDSLNNPLPPCDIRVRVTSEE